MTSLKSRNEAALRLRNTDYLLKRLSFSIQHRLRLKLLTYSQADQLRREFWEARRIDVQVLRSNGLR